MRLVEIGVDPEVGHDGRGDALAAALELDRRTRHGLQLEGGHVAHAPAQHLREEEVAVEGEAQEEEEERMDRRDWLKFRYSFYCCIVLLLFLSIVMCIYNAF